MNPLANLADIELPSDVPLWPLAPGYWLLIGLIIGTMLGLAIWLYRRFQNRHLRQQLAHNINAIRSLPTQHPEFLYKLQSGLKVGATLSLTNKHLVMQGDCYGDQWEQILKCKKIAQQSPHIIDSLMVLQRSLYNPSEELTELETLREYVISWINSSELKTERHA